MDGFETRGGTNLFQARTSLSFPRATAMSPSLLSRSLISRILLSQALLVLISRPGLGLTLAYVLTLHSFGPGFSGQAQAHSNLLTQLAFVKRQEQPIEKMISFRMWNTEQEYGPLVTIFSINNSRTMVLPEQIPTRLSSGPRFEPGPAG